ncbi:MAG: transglycosylase domain-containing protein [Alistipes sp.]|nr:transglycosylase domain-containing protein [Alistipes sp.]
MATNLQKNGSRKWLRRVIIAMWCILLLAVIALTTLFALAKSEALGPMPTFDELENPKTNLATQIYSADGEVIGTYFIENRTYLSYEELFPEDREKWLKIDGHELPPIVAALLATEDIRFFDHPGIDFEATARAGIRTVILRQSGQGGGSTITQQLAKNLYKTRRNKEGLEGNAGTLAAKAQEYVIATQLEHNYTKEEIVAMYLNTVEFSNSNFGIKSAANNFFGKDPRDLLIEEAAVIAGQVKAPGTYAPLRRGEPNERARERRNTVLQRMAVAGAITQEMADSLKALPIDLSQYRRAGDAHNEGSATYFREMVRRTMMAHEPQRRNYYTKWDYEQALKEYHENPIVGWCHKNLKANGEKYDIYRDGLKIYTTVDSRMQHYAEEALAEHMAEIVQPRMNSQIKNSGSIYVDVEPDDEKQRIETAMRQTDRWKEMEAAGHSKKEILAAFNTPRNMEVFTFRGVRDTTLTPRDSLLHYKSTMRGAFVAIDPHSGYVRAYVGGPDYRYFKYDAATQGKRQVGSTSKPFIYTFAIDHLGLTPCTPVPNLPVSIETPMGIWSPKEAGEVEYSGVHPLYWGLAQSRNNYSAWIMKQAKQPEAVAEFIHDMGIKSFIDPVAALCIGSYDSNPYEMASAYCTFANEGVRIDPIFVTRIEDSQGNLLATFTPKSNDVLSKRVAYTMITMMQKVVTTGTARRMLYEFKFNDVEVAAKTGTTNDNVDAWFMCAVPNLVMGTWVGGEENSIHFTRNADGSRIALPITGKFLTKVYKDGSLGVERTDRFKRSDEVPDYSCSENMESVAEEEESTFFIDDNEFF